MNKHVTHEPLKPINWPFGHVNVVFTGIEEDECLKITIHDSEHFLHATTARELHTMLGKKLEEFNKLSPFPV